MTDSPRQRACPPAGTPALEQHQPHPEHTTGDPEPSDPSAAHSMRRPATASRTYGRYRGRPAGRSLTPPPTSTRATTSGEQEQEDQLQEHGVDRPRSFRNDQLHAGLMTRWPRSAT